MCDIKLSEGIALFDTNGAVVENNTANGNSLNGILLVNSNNTVRKNDAEFNQNDGIGVSASNGNLVETMCQRLPHAGSLSQDPVGGTGGTCRRGSGSLNPTCLHAFVRASICAAQAC